jgi:hypothetical protein
MAQPHDTTQTITATVEAVNERGIKINGGWLNVSRFRPVALPPVGAHVAVDVQGDGWLHAVTVLDAAAAQDAHSAPERPVAPPNTRDDLIADGIASAALGPRRQRGY